MRKETSTMIFKPSILRFGLLCIALYCVCYLAGSIRNIFDQRFDLIAMLLPAHLITAGIGTIFFSLLAMYYNRIKITDDEIEGPQIALSGLVTIAIRDIDLDSLKKQMQKTGISARIVIKSDQNEKIVIDKFSFSRKTIKQIVGIIEERYQSQKSAGLAE